MHDQPARAAANLPDAIPPSPESLFAVGRHLVEKEQFAEALPAFEKALDAVPGEPHYLSFYGLCLVKTRRDPSKGRTLCEAAVRKAFYRTDLLANLATVFLATGDRKRAVDVLRRGLRLDRKDRRLNQLLRQMGFRQSPVVPFLKRSHPLNRLAGRLRHTLFGSRETEAADWAT
jgi:Flp pilus assembly protein TadD